MPLSRPATPHRRVAIGLVIVAFGGYIGLWTALAIAGVPEVGLEAVATSVLVLGVAPLMVGIAIARWWAVALALVILIVPLIGGRCEAVVFESDVSGTVCAADFSAGETVLYIAISAVALGAGVAIARVARFTTQG
jgi:uncharacterized membrane protein